MGKSKITVMPEYNMLLVSEASYFNLALNLANAYEKETKEDWTIKKDYLEN